MVSAINFQKVVSREILNDTRTVCIYCGCESVAGDVNIHCGEAGAFLTRAEYLEYTGEDHFAD
jgi:hypothetical protein